MFRIHICSIENLITVLAVQHHNYWIKGITIFIDMLSFCILSIIKFDDLTSMCSHGQAGYHGTSREGIYSCDYL